MTNGTKVLITGGTGVLGKELRTIFPQYSIPYVIASRTNPSNLDNWLHVDLETGNGLEEATKNKEIIFHLASGTKKFNKNIDIEGTKRLLQKAKVNGVLHFIYISIVGIDSVPLTYYQYKLQAEKEIINSGIPYTILRSTQFHEFIDFILHKLLKLPIALVPKRAKFQPIEAKVVAQKLFTIGQGQPLNKIINIGGKETFELDDIAKNWLSSQSKRRLLLNLPLFGKLNNALKNGGLTCTEKANDSITWGEWLEEKYKPK